MPECPICFGEGEHDMRDTDALVTEHLDDVRLAEYRKIATKPIVACDECEGTGVVSDERLREIEAAAVAAVDQVIAEHNHREAERSRH